ncbi:hypothetical protein NL676_032425 [Syzygium grande]|nr:hypothetical protein NL676_032425 [Syzygium grande]
MLNISKNIKLVNNPSKQATKYSKPNLIGIVTYFVDIASKSKPDERWKGWGPSTIHTAIHGLGPVARGSSQATVGGQRRGWTRGGSEVHLDYSTKHLDRRKDVVLIGDARPRTATCSNLQKSYKKKSTRNGVAKLVAVMLGCVCARIFQIRQCVKQRDALDRTKYTIGDRRLSSKATQGQSVGSGTAAKLDGRHKVTTEKEDAPS